MTRLALVLTLVTASFSCAGEKAALAPKEFELGASRVQVIVPVGWEPLDQGKQKRFRQGEFEIVLQNLGQGVPPPRKAAATEGTADVDAYVDWGLATVGHDQRREVKSRRTITIDGRDAIDIETWNRLDHTNPQRILLVIDGGDLLALHTERMAFADSLAAFDALRDSFHFVSARR
jgi:hypothetical protein